MPGKAREAGEARGACGARRILGLDPSTKATGWSIIEDGELLAKGEIRPRHARKPLRRLTEIYTEIESIIDRYRPDEASTEDSFVWHLNKDTAMRLSEARGVIMLALGRHGTPLVLFKPATLKLVLTGAGKASKQQMIEAARKRFALPALTDNEADAIAAALALLEAPDKGNVVA